MDQQQISLSLTVAEANAVLDALGRLPYVQVYELIGTIQEQAQTQLRPNLAEAREETA
ncbi:hypothetical protein [Nonomuraea sp. NPDC050783]|uniref:hypothetical protein n=1 Tax=Nonomuraea sp. NPDC050783 TaxID=3154634 RepID=UPI003465235B